MTEVRKGEGSVVGRALRVDYSIAAKKEQAGDSRRAMDTTGAPRPRRVLCRDGGASSVLCQVQKFPVCLRSSVTRLLDDGGRNAYAYA